MCVKLFHFKKNYNDIVNRSCSVNLFYVRNVIVMDFKCTINVHDNEFI